MAKGVLLSSCVYVCMLVFVKTNKPFFLVKREEGGMDGG